MAVIVKNKKSGKEVVLLNPAEKGRKAALELKRGVKMTNAGKFKLDENKKGIKLTDKERAFRAGYLAARNDSAKAFKARQKKKGK